MSKRTPKKSRVRKVSKINQTDMVKVESLTDAQDKVLKHYGNGDNLVLAGSAGTGKTFLALAMALEEILDPDSDYEKLLIIRSVVPVRDIGFLPGTEEEKIEVYTAPYRSIVDGLFKTHSAYDRLAEDGKIDFQPTSFVRGKTWDQTIVVVDECQNLGMHELCSVITRCGLDTRIIFAGDYYQSDFTKEEEANGLLDFIKILKEMKDFSLVDFTWEDIVRSGLVRDFIMTKEKLEKSGTIQKKYGA